MEVTKDGGPKREERVLEDFIKKKKKNYKNTYKIRGRKKCPK